MLAERELAKIPRGVDSIPCPFDPQVRLFGLDTSTPKMMKSAAYPCIIDFHSSRQPSSSVLVGSVSAGGSTERQSIFKAENQDKKGLAIPESGFLDITKIFFKSGDDLRQDQMVLQLINLMDSLLKKVNLDLKFLTYGVLATSPNGGVMEFVQDMNQISAIEKTDKSISGFLRRRQPDPNGPFGIKEDVHDTFIKSCAGNCVATYILGIGDRHLENILVTGDGHLVHIDFPFIFGRDPKFYIPFR